MNANSIEIWVCWIIVRKVVGPLILLGQNISSPRPDQPQDVQDKNDRQNTEHSRITGATEK